MLMALCVIGLGWLASADIVIGQPTTVKDPMPLHNRQALGQTFAADADGLRRIDILFAFQRDARERDVRLTVYDGDGRARATVDLPASELRWAWHAFEFPPLDGIAGQTIRLDLTRNAPVRASVGVRIGPGGAYPGGYGVIDNVPDPSFDLAFRAYSATAPNPAAHLQQLAAVTAAVTAGRPGLSGQPGLIAGLGAMYGVGLATLAWVLLVQRRWRR
jgi:hypothetical protein